MVTINFFRTSEVNQRLATVWGECIQENSWILLKTVSFVAFSLALDYRHLLWHLCSSLKNQTLRATVAGNTSSLAATGGDAVSLEFPSTPSPGNCHYLTRPEGPWEPPHRTCFYLTRPGAHSSLVRTPFPGVFVPDCLVSKVNSSLTSGSAPDLSGLLWRPEGKQGWTWGQTLCPLTCGKDWKLPSWDQGTDGGRFVGYLILVREEKGEGKEDRERERERSRERSLSDCS